MGLFLSFKVSFCTVLTFSLQGDTLQLLTGMSKWPAPLLSKRRELERKPGKPAVIVNPVKKMATQ